ncbi:4Fe-4S dicluster domain-containing protein [Vibrio alginolyticus]|uniref:4Fe-4S dicluster domain-containing protein n=1 Tax=Vibrio sp. B1FLJ16 TaxID=2751178 RepID=UPI0015F43988|nr:4Fe-4S dicluster domain-containing protein [Vibrio sp. B1FLJ16]CAD7819056.1 4Fe-4S dicluster domain [Vibrio sp. B1FLJ16]CAD7819905.1 4Fe-4S dicluster domain [Vibrio sp. B1FLJ16]CAE6937187.1 4Fe-4S dicluster domain [Vibrio sp. B1FLJ16]CAE6941006.1 4Fe-4S dicluster domain [Vibrio sp. B1FLJ16]
MTKTYELDSLDELRLHLLQSRALYQIVANSEQDSGDYYWQQVLAHDLPVVINKMPTHSAKGFFFTEREPLYVFDGEVFKETLPNVEPFVLFGVQSCDLVAIHYQDEFFDQDPYYQARRKQALLVGMDCTAPCENGFCPTVNAGPSVRDETADLALHPLDGQRWLLVVLTKLGEESLQGFDLKLASTHDKSQRWENIAHCEQLFPDDRYLIEGIEKISEGRVPEEFWQQVGIQCLGCSGCTTLCPTCSCFGTRSVSNDSNAEKSGTSQVRFWDSCLYEGFQREASFHNPSKEAGQRVERFWYHKFGMDFVPEFGRYGCVGCGRCEQTCPGVIGVHSLMKRIIDDV